MDGFISFSIAIFILCGGASLLLVAAGKYAVAIRSNTE